MLYLDHAATGPVRPEVREAMLPFLGERYGNPSSHHTVGEDAAAVLADARRRVASVLGMRPGDVIFTSGATEANNLAIKGVVLAGLLRHGRAGHVVTSAVEHESILASVDYLERVHGTAVTRLPVDADGLVSPEVLADALRDDTALVSLGYANNEIGTVQDAAGLAAVTANAHVPFHLDAVQAAGWLPLAGTGADALSIAGHKIGAPQGIGALAIRGRIPLEPLLHGGGQERDRRSGTQNVAGAVGLAVALELAERERGTSSERVSALRQAVTERVLALVPEARLTGHPSRRLPGTASFTFAGVSGEAVLLELERRGVVSSSGSACAAGSDEPSHVLLALGVAPEVAQASVRFSFGHRAEIDPGPLADAIAASIAAVRSR
ncbi:MULTISPECIES: cysteine desulfurase family protein [unclassified Microbacterium]|uniref:cysteine desulfurase family protein n=1 Tax=unclassified Microbacterium TaxID=2609290 RepID=UPI0003613CB3|nr:MULTISPECIES: cysteine desulfurase family protein [unclassified Microbacterium]SDG25972.1 cysteine desulfurase [Microbacterium sp. 77mftsu3.1]